MKKYYIATEANVKSKSSYMQNSKNLEINSIVKRILDESISTLIPTTPIVLVDAENTSSSTTASLAKNSYNIVTSVFADHAISLPASPVAGDVLYVRLNPLTSNFPLLVFRGNSTDTINITLQNVTVLKKTKWATFYCNIDGQWMFDNNAELEYLETPITFAHTTGAYTNFVSNGVTTGSSYSASAIGGKLSVVGPFVILPNKQKIVIENISYASNILSHGTIVNFGVAYLTSASAAFYGAQYVSSPHPSTSLSGSNTISDIHTVGSLGTANTAFPPTFNPLDLNSRTFGYNANAFGDKVFTHDISVPDIVASGTYTIIPRISYYRYE